MKTTTYFRICDLQFSRRQDEGDQRCREEHLQQGNVTLLRLEAFGEGLSGVYAKAS